MAIATYADWETRLLNPRERIGIVKNNPSAAGGVTGRFMSMFVANPLIAANPTTAAVPARDITGALGQQNGGATALRVPGMNISGGSAGTLVLCDRLSHQGGLDGTVTTAQTTNLPTAALTRYTSGVGVMCMLEVYATLGSTGTTVSVVYTNQGGTGSQVSPAMVFGGTGFREDDRGVLIPCAVGDTGFRSVESVTVLSTTGTAGNFGVTLFKPLAFIPVGFGESYEVSPVLGTMGGGLPEILDDACLFWAWLGYGSVVQSNAMLMTIPFAED